MMLLSKFVKNLNLKTSQLCIVGTLALTGCVTPHGPSVPFQSGKNLVAAQEAVQSCARFAPKGGRNRVTGNYVAGVLLGGLVGPIIVASNQSVIRSNGEARAVDRCLIEQGYVRRDLTHAEVKALNSSNKFRRQALLDHLVGGGSLQTFETTS